MCLPSQNRWKPAALGQCLRNVQIQWSVCRCMLDNHGRVNHSYPVYAKSPTGFVNGNARSFRPGEVEYVPQQSMSYYNRPPSNYAFFYSESKNPGTVEQCNADRCSKGQTHVTSFTPMHSLSITRTHLTCRSTVPAAGASRPRTSSRGD